MTNRENHKKVNLPKELVNRIEKRVGHTDFESAADYISYVLEEVLYQVEDENELPESESVDEQQVKERLKSLGYLNN